MMEKQHCLEVHEDLLQKTNNNDSFSIIKDLKTFVMVMTWWLNPSHHKGKAKVLRDPKKHVSHDGMSRSCWLRFMVNSFRKVKQSIDFITYLRVFEWRNLAQRWMIVSPQQRSHFFAIFTVLPQPPCSPDLAPANIFYSPRPSPLPTLVEIKQKSLEQLNRRWEKCH